MGRLLFCLALVIAAVPEGAWAARLDPSLCTPVVLATPENDIRLERDPRGPGKPVRVPSEVVEAIRAFASQVLNGADPADTEGLTCDLLLGKTYRLTGFGGNELYVAHAGLPAGGEFFALILHDPKSGRVTKDPPLIGAKWPQIFGTEDGLARAPFVSKGRLLRGRGGQIVFQERVHNGTVYNGVVYRYFDVGPWLELTQVFARETRVLDATDGRRLYMREITEMTPDRLRVDLYEAPIGGGARKRLGYVVARSGWTGEPFRVTERHAEAGVDAGSLVSFCEGREDDRFLRKGCDFYY